MPSIADDTRAPGPSLALQIGMALGRLATLPARRRRRRRFVAANQAKLGTATQAINYALDKLVDDDEVAGFIQDWRVGNLDEWPDYRPSLPPAPSLGLTGWLTRAAAVFGGLFASLLLLSALFAPEPGGAAKDPLQTALELTWSAAVLITCVVAWRAALKPAGGEG